MRLKRGCTSTKAPAFRWFQYQKGAIKTYIVHGPNVSPNKFQYQKGAIKTWSLGLRQLSDRAHFNTKKVRLKRLLRRTRRGRFRYFQYQKGAIKTREGGLGAAGAHRFQYQKGAIKTVIYDAIIYTSRVFQYQKGAIKTHQPLPGQLARTDFQYQKGAIKTLATFSRWVVRSLLSIPKRCD